MHQWRSNHTSGQGTTAHASGSQYFNTDAFVQQGSAAYENNYEFYTTTGGEEALGWEIEHLKDVQSAQATISPDTAFKHRYDDKNNNVPRHVGSPLSPQHAVANNYYPAYPAAPTYIRRSNFTDFGNLKNYHRQRLSRVYKKEKFYYFAPLNNMGTSGSTGGHPTSTVSMSGWAPAELANGWYRSGIRPISKSYEAAEVSDYKPAGFRKLFYEGCKLVGSDFNMPVLATVDGGPVVEVTDTNPNAIIISARNANDGDLRATGQTMQRSI